MTKKKQHHVGGRRVSSPRTRPAPASARNAALDALRGLAILLMVIDHVAYYLWDIPIAPTTIRIATRLSMPLFCALMGYFLACRANINWNRFYQLCLAAAVVNLVFFTTHHKLEILASLLIVYCLFLCFRDGLCLAVGAVFFNPWDPTLAWFDYPLPIVLACVAQGMVLRRLGWRVALTTAALITCGAWWVPPPSVYVLFFVIPSTLLIAWAAAHPQAAWPRQRLAWLIFPGRYPLTAYVTQYFVVAACARW